MSLQSKMGHACDRCCFVPGFQSAVPVILQALNALAMLAKSIAATGERAHAGNLVLARVTSTVQLVSIPALLCAALCSRNVPVPACLRQRSTLV